MLPSLTKRTPSLRMKLKNKGCATRERIAFNKCIAQDFDIFPDFGRSRHRGEVLDLVDEEREMQNAGQMRKRGIDLQVLHAVARLLPCRDFLVEVVVQRFAVG